MQGILEVFVSGLGPKSGFRAWVCFGVEEVLQASIRRTQ